MFTPPKEGFLFEKQYMRGIEIAKFYRGVIDSTLREGMQFHSANFRLDEQKKIVEMLGLIGVDRLEVSNPYGQEIRNTLTELVKIPNRPPFLAHVRNRQCDIQAATDLGLEGVNILCITSEERLKGMGITLEEHLGILQQNIRLAQKAKLQIRVSVEHYFNGDREQALRVYRVADDLGVDRIGVPDTLGVAMSWEVAHDIGWIRKNIRADIEVHFHNDTGGAVSNATIALYAGANWVDTTLGGIGERTGITPLGTLLAGLYTLDPSIVAKYQLEYLTPAENAIAQMVGKELPYNLPTSQNAFSHKAGIHLNAVMHHGPTVYEPFSPGVIGNQRNLIVGSVISGATTVEQATQFYEDWGRK